jgi:O-antigen/teichoic acid export membrane protein
VSLAANARSSVLWNAGFNIFSMLTQFVTTMILARLMSQEAYGQMGFVTDLIGFVSIFSMVNVIAHTLQAKADEEVPWQDHFSVAVLLNLGMMVVMNIIGACLWWTPKWREVAPFVHVMSITFLLSIAAFYRARFLERQFAWRRLRTLHAVGILLSTTVAISMANLGFGTWALLIPSLCPTLPFIYDLFVRERFRPTWDCSWTRLRPAFQFALARIASGIAFYGRQVLVSGTLSTMLGFAALGVVNRSIGLAQIFCVQIASMILTALYPMLTRVGEAEGNPARVGGLVLQTIAWTSIPIAVIFSLAAEPLILLVYGKNWLVVNDILPWAMAWGASYAIYWAAYNLLMARNAQRHCLYADLMNLAAAAGCLYWGLPQGINVYLQLTALMQIFTLLVVCFWLQQAKGIELSEGLWNVLSALIACAVATMVVIGFRQWLSASPRLWQHALLSVLFVVMYAAMLRLLFRNRLDQWLQYVPLQRYFRKLLFLPISP